MKNTYDELQNIGGAAESFGRDLAIIDEILTERMTTDAGRRLHQWRWRMMCDDKSVMKWVKTVRKEVQRSDADAASAFGSDEKIQKGTNKMARYLVSSREAERGGHRRIPRVCTGRRVSRRRVADHGGPTKTNRAAKFAGLDG